MTSEVNEKQQWARLFELLEANNLKKLEKDEFKDASEEDKERHRRFWGVMRDFKTLDSAEAKRDFVEKFAKDTGYRFNGRADATKEEYVLPKTKKGEIDFKALVDLSATAAKKK